jgi:flagellar hook assembly protein FlgD
MRYEVRVTGPVQLEVFDALGRLVRTLVHEAETAGVHEVLWDGRGDGGQELPSGVYLARLRSGEQAVTRRMTRVR